MKTCTVCKQELDYSYYHKSSRSKDGFNYRCKVCDKAARHSYQKNNRERFAEKTRRKNLKFKFGITLEEYYDMLEKQNHRCGICGTKDNHVPGKRREQNWSVDHCHETAKIRGLLCNRCNGGLGMLGDNVESIRKVLTYLETH